MNNDSSIASEIKAILEVWVTPSGATITVAITIFAILVLFFATSTGRQLLLRSRWKAQIMGSSIESTGVIPENTAKSVEDSKKSPAVQMEAKENKTEDDISPKPVNSDKANESWRIVDKIYEASRSRDEKATNDAFLELEKNQDGTLSREMLDTFRARIRLESNFSTVDELKKLEEQNLTWVRPSITLAKHYLSAAAHAFAEKHASIAVIRANKNDDLFDAFEVQADIYLAINKHEAAIDKIHKFMEKRPESGLLAKAYLKLADIYKAQLQHGMEALCLESALENNPDDVGARFRLAVLYGSREDSRHIAIHHYRVIISMDERYSGALNNLGVAYGELELKASQINSWRRARDFDFPYPAGNLAIELARSGFFEEAEAELARIPAELRSKERAADATDFIKTQRSEEDTRRAAADELVEEQKRLTRLNLEACAALAKNNKERIKIPAFVKDTNGHEWALEERNGEISGIFQSHSKKYKLNGQLAGHLAKLSCNETHHIRALGFLGLSSLGQAATLNSLMIPSPEKKTPEWIESTSPKDEFKAWLYFDDQKVDGITMRDKNKFSKLTST
jgi:tetratricopeptide (TPR) repeat protein